MSRRITQHKITTYRPQALVYFIDKDWMFKEDFSDLIVNSVDVADMIDINVNRGNLGVIGKFTLKINNKNNRYFIPDNIDDSILSLNKLSEENTRYNDNKIKKTPYPYSTAKEDRKSTRLNSSHIQKSRMPSSA